MARPTHFSDKVGKLHCASIYYDFAVDGGAIGEIELPGSLPTDAIVQGGLVDVLTTLTTAGADAGTIGLYLIGAGDVVVAIAVSNGGNPWDAGRHAIVPITAALSLKMTEPINRVKVLIAGQAVTAGKFVLHLFYVMSPNALVD